MTLEIDFLRLFFGFFLQVFPYAFLCVLPFSDKMRIKHGKLFTLFFVCICAGAFALSSVVMEKRVNDYDRLYQLINIHFMILFCVCILFYCLLVRERLSTKIYVACYVATFAFFVSLFLTVLWDSKLAYYFPSQWNDGAAYSVCYDIFLLISTVPIFPIIYLLVKRQLEPTVKTLKGRETIYFALFSAILLLFLVVSFAILDTSFIESKMALTLCLTVCLTVCAAYCVCALLIAKIRQTDELKIDLLTSKYNNDIITQQYKNIRDNIDNQRILRHDFRHQLITLRGLCGQSNSDIRKYLTEYLSYIPDYEIVPICANPIFNSILNYYKTTAESKEFTFTCTVNLPVAVEIAEVDIVTVLGNLLENALDAGTRLTADRRFIDVNIDFSNKMIGIAVDNSFDGEIKKEDDIFLSTKHDGKAFGLQSVKIIAEKYNGSAAVRLRDKVFCASVMLSNTCGCILKK